MQDLDWNDLRHLLALGREGRPAAAARRLGVNETTVARRLRAAERALGRRLFLRGGDGRLQPTEAGARVLAHAERVERELAALGEALGGGDLTVAGTVRLTAVPLLLNRLLIPALPRLLARHPQLRLELLGEPRDLDLTRREADLALRLARPRGGGRGVLARRLGRLDYALVAPAGLDGEAVEQLPWIGYEEGMAGLPPARWIEAAAGTAPRPLAVNDAEAILAAVRAGLGRSLLPRALASVEPELQCLEPAEAPPSRELWLLIHADLRPLPRLDAVVVWLEETLARAGIARAPG